MANIRELRGRIRSVKGISQITRAMEMVASTKLRRFQERAARSRPYALEVEELIGELATRFAGTGIDAEAEGIDTSLFVPREVRKVAAILVSSDRGLCGAYNANVFAEFERWLAEQSGREVDVYVVGRKAVEYVHHRGYHLAGYFEEVPLEKLEYADSVRIVNGILSAFQQGHADQVHLIYTRFESMMRYVPTAIQLLPIDPRAIAEAKRAREGGAAGQSDEPSLRKGGGLLLEPDPASLFGLLIPRYLETRLFNALVESLTSEYASRRISMKNATEAANDMVGYLQRIYNRVRQERITKELLEIVGGAEALK